MLHAEGFKIAVASNLTAPNGEPVRQLYCQWKLDLRITGCIFKGKRLDWAAYSSQITTTAQLRSVNHTIRRPTDRFCPGREIRPNSLIKTYYKLQRGMKAGDGYIPNLNALTVPLKREKLAMWLGSVDAKLSDSEVERRFEIKASKAMRDLQEDMYPSGQVIYPDRRAAGPRHDREFCRPSASLPSGIDFR